MISRTYYKYIWLLNTLLQKEQSLQEIDLLWKKQHGKICLVLNNNV